MSLTRSDDGNFVATVVSGHLKQFKLSHKGNPGLLWFCSPSLCDWPRNLRHLFNQSD